MQSLKRHYLITTFSWCAALVLVAAGCGKGEGARLRFEVEGSGLTPAMSMLGGQGFGNFLVGQGPTTINGFHCLAVNVIGPGIAPTFIPQNQSGSGPGFNGTNEAQIFERLVNGQSHCTYPGVTSTVVSMAEGGAVEVSVPTGPNRLVQVLGLELVSGACPVGTRPIDLLIDGPNGQIGATKFVAEVGRQRVDIFGDMTLDISNNYNAATADDVRCRGNSGSSGSSYKEVVLADQPAAYWPMDEGGGLVARDASGALSCAGAACNGALDTYMQFSIPGVLLNLPGTAYQFAGSGNPPNFEVGPYFAYSNHATQDYPFSLEAWIRPGALGEPRAIFGKGFSTFEYVFRLQPDGAYNIMLYGSNAGSSIQATTSALANIGTVNHVVATYDGSRSEAGLSIYVNGALAPVTQSHTGTYDVMANSSGGQLALGSIYYSERFDGDFGHAAVYSYGLSAAQVAAHYNAGISPPSSSSGAGRLDFGYGTPYLAIAQGEAPEANFQHLSMASDVYGGKLVVAGVKEFSTTKHVVIERFREDGAVDSTFHGGAAQIVNANLLYAGASAVKVVSVKHWNASIFVVGKVEIPAVNAWFVIKLSSDGELDTAFDGDGYKDFLPAVGLSGMNITDMVIDSAGMIYIGGYGDDATPDTHGYIAQVNGTTGGLVSEREFGFGQPGGVDVWIDRMHYDSVTDRVYIAGRADNYTGPRDVLMARLDNAGITSGTYDWAQVVEAPGAIAADPVTITGISVGIFNAMAVGYYGTGTPEGFMVARNRSDGVMVSAVGDAVKNAVVGALSTSLYRYKGIVADNRGMVLLVESGISGGPQRLMAFQPSGAPWAGFGPGGPLSFVSQPYPGIPFSTAEPSLAVGDGFIHVARSRNFGGTAHLSASRYYW
ncbi:MAG: LamG domain-containing protein [Bacteriovoracia bacterium]